MDLVHLIFDVNLKRLIVFLQNVTEHFGRKVQVLSLYSSQTRIVNTFGL